MSGAAITYLVERMIALGAPPPESDPTDRRKVILRVADHGMDVARGFFTPLAEHTRNRACGYCPTPTCRRAPHLRPPSSTRCDAFRAQLDKPLLPIECRLFEIEPVQHRAQHLVVDAPRVALLDERLALGGKHFQSQPTKRRCRALADLLVRAARAAPMRVEAPRVPVRAAPRPHARVCRWGPAIRPAARRVGRPRRAPPCPVPEPPRAGPVGGRRPAREAAG